MLFIRKESNPSGWAVSLGSVLWSGVEALVIPVQRIIQHPAFNSSNMDFDVALVQLSIPAPSSYTIQTLCLPSPTHTFFKGTECYITGWGSMREDGERVNLLQFYWMSLNCRYNLEDSLLTYKRPIWNGYYMSLNYKTCLLLCRNVEPKIKDNVWNKTLHVVLWKRHFLNCLIPFIQVIWQFFY